MIVGTLLTYGGKRYFWMGLTAGVVLLISYYYYYNTHHTPPSGSTTIGLIYGWLGFIAILVLMFLGIRKRWHASHLGTVQGWTSGHVYLGLLTLLVIPMHAGFRFGWDVHTLAFALLAIVVLSGIVGIWLYLTIPPKLTQYESGMLPDKAEAEINQILKELKSLVAGKSGVFQRAYEQEVARLHDVKPQGWRLLFKPRDAAASIAGRSRELRSQVAQIPPTEQDSFSKFSGLVLRKTELESFLASEMRLKNALESWLYVHLPLSLAMSAAVAVHLLVVLYY
jgi:hypothetical protein